MIYFWKSRFFIFELKSQFFSTLHYISSVIRRYKSTCIRTRDTSWKLITKIRIELKWNENFLRIIQNYYLFGINKQSTSVIQLRWNRSQQYNSICTVLMCIIINIFLINHTTTGIINKEMFQVYNIIVSFGRFKNNRVLV